MKRLIFAVAGTVLLAAGSASIPAVAQSPAGLATDPNTVVARVGEKEIKTSDVAAAYGQLPPQYQQMPISVLFNQLVDQLVNRQLMLEAGLEQKLDEDEAILTQVSEFRNFVIQRAYLDRYIEKTVTDAMLRKEYDSTIGSEKGKEQVKASHILLQSEEAALAVLKELDGGAGFAQTARTKSTGPSAENGGDLGFFNREQMVGDFSDAAFAMQEGETSAAPVKTQFGWHIIKVTGRRTLPPPPFEEVREQILDQLTRDALEAHMTELRGTTTVERFNPDGSPLVKDAAK